MRVYMAGVLALAAWSGQAIADPAIGTWLTEADNKGQVAHVNVKKCKQALCGTIIKVFSPSGDPIDHKNVGKMIFWDTSHTGGGAYTGRALVPAFNKEYDAQMTLIGNRLTVKGCYGPVCHSQKWTRVN